MIGLMRRQLFSLMIGRLLSLFAALALLLAPVSIAEASAAGPGHAQMMQGMGCHIPRGSSTHHDKMTGKICCASMGVAVAIDAARPSSNEAVQSSPFVQCHAAWRLGYLEEIATPPPRSS